MEKTQADYEQAMLGAPDEQPIDPNGFYFIDFVKCEKIEKILNGTGHYFSFYSIDRFFVKTNQIFSGFNRQVPWMRT